jgi:hypothetical protein
LPPGTTNCEDAVSRRRTSSVGCTCVCKDSRKLSMDANAGWHHSRSREQALGRPWPSSSAGVDSSAVEFTEVDRANGQGLLLRKPPAPDSRKAHLSGRVSEADPAHPAPARGAVDSLAARVATITTCRRPGISRFMSMVISAQSAALYLPLSGLNPSLDPCEARGKRSCSHSSASGFAGSCGQNMT